MKIYHYVVLALLSFTACHSDDFNADLGVAVALQIKVNDPVNDVAIWAFNDQQKLAEEFYFESPDELASTRLKLSAGNYTLVAITNMGDAFAHNAQKEVSTLDDLLVVINDPSSSPAHLHYGQNAIQVENESCQRSTIMLNRAMTEMTFSISNVPSEVTGVEMWVVNSAKGGYPGIEKLTTETERVSFGLMKPEQGKVQFTTKQLMPTVSSVNTRSSSKANLEFTMNYDNGVSLTFQAQTPALNSGGIYAPVITYSLFRPGITIEIDEINGWIELPPIQDDILYPNL